MEIIDSKNVCRLCLSKDRFLTQIFPENDLCNSSIASKIMACVGLEVELGDNLPDQICDNCLEELERWERFKKMCECANEELLTGMPPLSDEVLEKNLQKGNSDHLETSSDFGLGNVSLLEHDSLFDSIDGSGDENQVRNDLNISKSITDCGVNQESETSNNCDMTNGQIEKEMEETHGGNKRRKWIEKYNRIYMSKYQCDLCLKVFSKFNLLLQHDRIDHSDITMSVVCDKCHRLFISTQRLNTHYQMKHRDKIYECDVCGLKSASEKSLKVHKTRHSGRFICDICGLVANTRRILRDHKQTHLAASERPVYKCNVCDRVYKHQHTLSEHSKTHLSVNPEWECNLCNKKFKTNQYLNKHKISHSSETSVVCDECGAVLKNKSVLYVHKLKHKEKQHGCWICDKMFITKNLLQRHMSIHSRKLCVCSICNKSFSRNDTLMAHLKTHQNTQVYSCDHCGDTFSLQKYLKRHLVKVHKLN